MPILPEQCATEDALALTVRTGGLKGIKIDLVPEDATYTVCVEINLADACFYLATRRNPTEPRKFKSVDVAIAHMQRLFGARTFLVNLA